MQKMQIKDRKNGCFVVGFLLLLVFCFFFFVTLYSMQRSHSEYVKMVHSSPFDSIH